MAKPSRRTEKIVGIILLALNSKTWAAISKLSDVDFIFGILQKTRPHMTALFHIVRDWGWVGGLALLAWSIFGSRPQRTPELPAGEAPGEEVTQKGTQPSAQPYPTLRIFRHEKARQKNQTAFHQITDRFTQAGWRVEGATTDLPQHANGVRIRGGTSFEREMAKWGLDGIGVEWQQDDGGDPPQTLEVIVGVYEPQRQKTVLTEIDSLKVALEETQNQREAIRGQLGAAQGTLRECQANLAMGRLGLLAWRYEREKWDVKVTVRFIEYADSRVADRIAGLFRTHTRWLVNVVRDDGSHLRPTHEFRIVFESGVPELVRELATIFNDGNLMEEPIGAMEIIDSTKWNVVITIFPWSTQV
jgi:hypothetical protein